MDTDVQEFVEMFKDENELQKAIASVLRRMDGVSGVEITQGPREHGKDIVFYRCGGLGEPKLYACVVKNEKITGSVASNRGAKTVLLQAEQAFDEPYIAGNGSREKVEHVYIMCPYECSQQTMDSIAERLRHRPATFVCGGKLIDLFHRHWPQFLMFNSSLLSSYVASLKRGLDEDNPLKYVSDRHSILAAAVESFSKVYVKQDFYKTFRQHGFKLDIPDLRLVLSPISLERCYKLRHGLVRVAAFVVVSEIWSSSLESSRRQQIRDALIECANLIASLWDRGYDQDLRQKSQEAATLTTRENTRIQIAEPDSILAIVDDVWSLVERLLKELSSLVKDANQFVSSQPLPADQALRSEELLKYCVVEEVSRRIPDIVTAMKPETEVEFSDAVIRGATSAVLISGPAGYGKSSYCKWNVLADIEQLAADNKARLPVYIPLHKLSREATQSPMETFFRAVDLRELVTNPRYNDSISGIRLYLDGLDEVPSSERQQELIGLARTICQEDKRISLVVTAREHVCGPWLNWMPRVRIRRFSELQSKELAANWLEDQVQHAEFRKQLESTPPLQPLMQIPLLATLIIAVFRNLRQLPESKIRLYEMFVELMSGGWDLAKNIKRDIRFGPVIKISLLSRLAGLLQINQRRDCSRAEIEMAMKDVMPADTTKCPDLLQELIEDGLLVRSGDIYYFSHHSFQEYLAAKDLADPSGRRQTQVLKWYLEGNNWWRDVVLFYISMQAPQDIENWIRKTVELMTVRSPQMAHRIEREFHFLMEFLTLTFSGYRPRSFELHPSK